MNQTNTAEQTLQDVQLEERATKDRYKMDRPGRLIFANLQDSCDVRMVDVSSGGVKLMCDTSVFVPRKFFLVTAGRDIGHVRYACDMRWRVGSIFGARFEEPLGQAIVDAIINQ